MSSYAMHPNDQMSVRHPKLALRMISGARYSLVCSTMPSATPIPGAITDTFVWRRFVPSFSSVSSRRYDSPKSVSFTMFGLRVSRDRYAYLLIFRPIGGLQLSMYALISLIVVSSGSVHRMFSGLRSVCTTFRPSSSASAMTTHFVRCRMSPMSFEVRTDLTCRTGSIQHSRFGPSTGSTMHTCSCPSSRLWKKLWRSSTTPVVYCALLLGGAKVKGTVLPAAALSCEVMRLFKTWCSRWASYSAPLCTRVALMATKASAKVAVMGANVSCASQTVENSPYPNLLMIMKRSFSTRSLGVNSTKRSSVLCRCVGSCVRGCPSMYSRRWLRMSESVNGRVVVTTDLRTVVPGFRAWAPTEWALRDGTAAAALLMPVLGRAAGDVGRIRFGPVECVRPPTTDGRFVGVVAGVAFDPVLGRRVAATPGFAAVVGRPRAAAEVVDDVAVVVLVLVKGLRRTFVGVTVDEVPTLL
eukprot:PhM_4_TR6357/c0_g1_i1/m.39858